jgi:membrane protein
VRAAADVAVSRLDELRGTIDDVAEAIRKDDLLIAATAIAFRVLLAAIPATLFVIGLLGFLDLGSVWRSDVVPSLRDGVSPAAFHLIDHAVTYVLERQQVFWVTVGLGIAIWEMSGIVRAVGQILNRLYGVKDDRPGLERLRNSLLVGAASGALLLAAVAAARLVPLGIGSALGHGLVAWVVGHVIGLALAAVLLLAAIGVMVRIAPDVKRPLRWVSFGAVVVVVLWIVVSAVFAFYLTSIASYATVFGNMATVFVLLEYLFLVSATFVIGLTLDALAEGRA